jgi:thymidylate kinase
MDTSRRPILISFSGIDGAGKSTQIQSLHHRLTDAGLRVTQLAFWDDVAVLGHARGFFSHTVFKSEKGVGSPEAPVQRRDKNVQSWYMTPVRFLFYFLDAMALRSSLAKARRTAADVIIFDRYLYDELANLRLQHRSGRMYARWLIRIVPRPDIGYLLDADPLQARTRKPEYPLEFLRSNRQTYLTLSAWAGMTIVAPGPQEGIADRISAQVLEHLQVTSEPVAVSS